MTLIGKMKDESEGKIIDESVGLQSKMYSMKHIDGRESNIAKGVNIATEFNEFKDTLFNKKIEVRKIKSEHTKSTKYQYLFLMRKDLFQMLAVMLLLIFIKSSKNRLSQMIIYKKDSKRFS